LQHRIEPALIEYPAQVLLPSGALMCTLAVQPGASPCNLRGNQFANS
jgi:hypothetical protein